jgi:nucleotidyltransferase substrate binding protein (TIGR01987 family)
MEEVIKKYLQLKNALNRLDEGISYYDKIEEYDDQGIRRIIRDALIQRYEFTIELLWKLLHAYLRDKLGAKIEGEGSYKVLRSAQRNKLITEEEFYQLDQLIFDRNETSHTYFEPLAIQIADRIPAHYPIIKKIFDRIKLDETP